MSGKRFRKIISFILSLCMVTGIFTSALPVTTAAMTMQDEIESVYRPDTQQTPADEKDTSDQPQDTQTDDLDTSDQQQDTQTDDLNTSDQRQDILTDDKDTTEQPYDTQTDDLDALDQPYDTQTDDLDALDQPQDTQTNDLDTLDKPRDTQADDHDVPDESLEQSPDELPDDPSESAIGQTAGFMTFAPTAGPLPGHLIINQVFGGGLNDNTGSVTHCFVELYNPSDTIVQLDGWSLQVQNGDENSGTKATDWERFDFNGSHAVNPFSSFLIRMDEVAQGNAKLVVANYDVTWTFGRILSNRAYSVALVGNQNTLSKEITAGERNYVIDLVGAKNTGANDKSLNYENTPFGDMSKQKSVRRKDFQDTDNNATDFESVNYSSVTAEIKAQKMPRYSGDGAWGVEPPPVVNLPDHLIINQAYGNGKNADGAVSHSFIEIYNPTESAVDLSTWSLQYATKGAAGEENGAKWTKLNLGGMLPPKNSYLVRANGGRTINTRYEIFHYDQEWLQIVSNDSFKFALVNNTNTLNIAAPGSGQGVVDLIGACNPPAAIDFSEGNNPFTNMSKQRAARRINFGDTDNNALDFESIDYRESGISNSRLAVVRPRSLADGAWNAGNTTPPPPPPVTGDITFSRTAGLYQTEFDLTLDFNLSGAGNKSDYVIRYTLDGEDPTAGSTAYTSGKLLPMKDRTYDTAPLSQIPNTSTSGGGATHDTYYNPAPNTVFQGTVVKAQLFTNSGKPASDVYINSYFVSDTIFSRYGNMPVISIATPRAYFFDNNTGIYVLGSSGVPNWDNDWERPVYFEMFEQKGASSERVVSQGLGVRIHGGASRNIAQKTLRFYTRNGMVENMPLHNGAPVINYDLFKGAAKDQNGKPLTAGFKRFQLRGHSNDGHRALIRDPFSAAIGYELDCEVEAYRPAVVFLNGEFWGVYQLRERADDDYLAQYNGGSNNSYDIIEDPSTYYYGYKGYTYAQLGGMTSENGTEESIAYYLNTVDKIDKFIAANGINTTAAYDEIAKYVDIDNLIDYTILRTFIGDNDWVNKAKPDTKHFGKHQRLWRYTGTPTNVYGQDGKYRFIHYDGDFAFQGLEGNEGGGDSANAGVHGMAFDSISVIIDENPENYFFFNRLMLNDAFRKRFVNRYMDVLNTYFSIGNLHSILDGMKAEINMAMDEHILRWNIGLTRSFWESEIARIRSNLTLRTSPNTAVSGIMRGLDKHAQSARATLTLKANDGYVKLNGIDINSGTPGVANGANWSGQYHVGFTQTLEAMPAPGKAFEKYIIKTIANGQTHELFTREINLDMAAGGVEVTAVFGDGAPVDKIIINQAYGTGPLDNSSAISHSFIELYNPNDKSVSLAGWSLQLQNGDAGIVGGIPATPATEWEKLDFGAGDVIAPHGYFLVRLALAAKDARCLITKSDKDWTSGRVLSNRAFSAALVSNQTLLTKTIAASEMSGVVDLFGGYNTLNTDVPLNFETKSVRISKQMAARRLNYQDTDNNFDDFEGLDYRYPTGYPGIPTNLTSSAGISDATLEQKGPRYSGGIAFGGELPDPGDPAIVFSRQAGFHVSAFELTLTTGSAYTIRYTLNGEDPVFGSAPYSGPIQINSRAGAPDAMTWTNWQNTFAPDAGEISEGRYVPPADGTNYKGTVVKARAFDSAGKPASKIYVNTYFVDSRFAAAKLPVISISTPQANLLDNNIGIYVRGNNSDPNLYNYNQSGFEWERPTFVEMFENGSRVVSQGMGLRMHGGFSRHAPQKNLRFYARQGTLANGMEIIDGRTTVDYDLFDGDAKNASGNTLTSGFKRFMLRAAANDATGAFLRDPFAAELVEDYFKIDTMAYRPVFAFINGEFWGLYDLRERYDEDYLAQVYGGGGANYTILENPTDVDAELGQGVDTDVDYYLYIVNQLKLQNAAQPAGYAEYLKYVDEDSLIDYVILNTFIGNDSWPHNNQRIWRYKGPADGNPWHDGKYRWLAYDMDMSVGGGYPDWRATKMADRSHKPFADSLTRALQRGGVVGKEPLFFFVNLWNNRNFRDKFINRYMDSLNNWFSAENTVNVLNELSAAIGGEHSGAAGNKPIELQKYRWNYTLGYSDWLTEIANMRTWLAARADPEGGITKPSAFNFYGQSVTPVGLAGYAQYGGQIAPLTLENQGSGHIRLNGVDLPPATAGRGPEIRSVWNGNYFVGYSQTITAVPAPGNEFVKFVVTSNSTSGSYDSTEQTLNLPMIAGGYTVKAIYKDGLLPGNIIILQAYGAGTQVDGSISHSFIELYNPTDGPISMDGCSLRYNGTTAANGAYLYEDWQMLPLSGTLPANTSYLIRANGKYNAATNRYEIYKVDGDGKTGYDLDWDVVLSNRLMMIAFVNHQNPLGTNKLAEIPGLIDAIASWNDIRDDRDSKFFYEGWQDIAVGDVTKQKSVRRVNFGIAVVAVSYRSLDPTHPSYNGVEGISETQLVDLRPCSLADGSWTPEKRPPLPKKPSMTPPTIFFSADAGLYKSGFPLTLTTNSDYMIRYTLDGSDPTGASKEYKNIPIQIADKTTDKSADILSQIPRTAIQGENDMTKGTYVPPTPGTNFKGTVVKAMLFDVDGKPVEPMYIKSYFVSDSIVERYGGLPVISISTPAGNLFDPATGLYMNPNFHETGADWERPAFFEMFEVAEQNGGGGKPFSDQVISQGMGVRMHGGWSRNNPQKTFRFYARSGNLVNGMPITNGKIAVAYDLFKGGAIDGFGNPLTSGFTRFLLRSAGNDLTGGPTLYNEFTGAFMRDAIVSVISRDYFDFTTMAYRPAVAFINGEFWGLYNIRQRYDDEFLALAYGGNKDNYTIIENPTIWGYTEVNQGSDEIDGTYYKTTVNQVWNMNLAVNDNYKYVVDNIVDENSLIDYVIIQTFIANRDWAASQSNNQRIWRYTGAKDTSVPEHDGKYRWMLYDTDESLGAGADTLNHGWPIWTFDYDNIIDKLLGNGRYNLVFFTKLWENAKFKDKFINRYMDVLNTALRSDVTVPTVKSMRQGIDKLMQAEQKLRWNYTLSYADWKKNVDGIENWLTMRADMENAASTTSALRSNVRFYKKANAELAGLTLINQEGRGHMVLNGMPLATGYPGVTDQAFWKGYYYSGYEQTITAVPNAGESFKCFIVTDNTTGDSNISYEQTIRLTMSGGGYTVIAQYGDTPEDYIIGVVGVPEYAAAFVGEIDSLPKIFVRYLSGRTEQAVMEWDTAKFMAAKAYHTTNLSGKVAGTEITVNIALEIIPRGLVYFIDAGTADWSGFVPGPNDYNKGGKNVHYPIKGSMGNIPDFDITPGSAAYDAVKARLGPLLLNDKSDQPFAGDAKWGISPYTIEDLNYYIDDELDMKFSVGYRSFNKYRPWNSEDPKFLDYKLDLPAGTYEITTGHYAWHGIPDAEPDPDPGKPLAGNWPRDLQVWFGTDTSSGEGQHWLPDNWWKPTFVKATYGDPPAPSYHYFNEIGQSKIFTHNPYVHAGGLLSIRVEAVNYDGSSLTFIGVRDLGVSGNEIVAVYGDKDFHVAAYPGETDALPSKINVLYANGDIGEANVSWNYNLVTEDKLYRTVNLTGIIAGWTADILTAEVEVIPRGLVYYIDAATADHYDRGPDSPYGANYSLQRGDNIIGSAAYDAVKAKLGSSLLNNSSDKLFYQSETNPALRWGIVEDTVQCINNHAHGTVPPEPRFRAGYTSWNSIERPEQDPYGHDKFTKSLEYMLNLPAGDYIITTAHFAWWGLPDNNYSRNFNVQIGDKVVTDTILYHTFGQYDILTHPVYRHNGGDLKIRVNTVDLDGVPLTFIGVRNVSGTNVYNVTFDADNGAAQYSVPVVEGGKVAEPVIPAKEGYTFLGWYNGNTMFDFNTPIFSSITLKVKWEAKVIGEVNGTIYIVAYADETNPLPGTVPVTYTDGSSGTVAVAWDYGPLATAKIYHDVKISGTIAGSGFTVDATINVIPRGLMYYIDAGTADWSGFTPGEFDYKDGNTVYVPTKGSAQGNRNPLIPGSAAYNAVKAKVGAPLKNNLSDQQFNGEWGLSPHTIEAIAYYEDETLPLRFSTGYAGFNYYRPWNAPDPKFIEYKLDLPAGDYVISTGHYAWHGVPTAPPDPDPGTPLAGNYPRDMQVWFGKDVGEHWLPDRYWQKDFTLQPGSYVYFDEIGQSEFFTHPKYTHEGGILSIRVEAVNLDGATLTFIGVQDVTGVSVTHNVTFINFTGGMEPYTVTVADGGTVTSPPTPVVDGKIFRGWFDEKDKLFDFSKPITKTLTLTAKYADVSDEVREILGVKQYHIAVYAGDTSPDLPSTVSVIFVDETPGAAPVAWNFEALNDAGNYDTISLLGTVRGTVEKLTAKVEVVPEGLVYYIDAGTADWSGFVPGEFDFDKGNQAQYPIKGTTETIPYTIIPGSAAYDAVKALLGDKLINDLSDQPYNNGWGVSPHTVDYLCYYEDEDHAIQFTTGYAGYNYYRPWNALDPNYVEYKLDLPAGAYVITTGHYAWWGVPDAEPDVNPSTPGNGNWPRDMQVWFGKDVGVPWQPDRRAWQADFEIQPGSYVYFDEIGQSAIFTHPTYVHSGGELSIRVEACELDGAALTFIGVQEVTDIGVTHNVMFINTVGGMKPYTVHVPDGETVTSPPVPDVEGYIFLGWFKEGASTPFNFDTPITSPLVLTARYERDLRDQLMIYQVYGQRQNANGGPISHSFVELYNPTDADIVLDGMSLQHIRRGASPWAKLDLQGVIPAHSSFLVRAIGRTTVETRYFITVFDQEWSLELENRVYKIALAKHTDLLTIKEPTKADGVVDFLAAHSTDQAVPGIYDDYPDFWWGFAPLTDISRQKSARRVTLVNTYHNEIDFESVDYREAKGMTEERMAEVRPRSAVEGPWHMVVFYNDDKTINTSVPVALNAKVAPRVTPEKDGYEFLGWFADGVSAPFNFNTPIIGDIGLTAKWRSISNNYTVTFDSDGGSDVEPQTVAEGETAVKPEDPDKYGYEFIGWYLNDVAFSFATAITGDIALTAKWTRITGNIAEILGKTTSNVAAFEGEEVPPTLPRTIEVRFDDGRLGYADIGWVVNNANLLAFIEPRAVGTIAGSSTAAGATVEVIPRDLIYFIDCGIPREGQPARDLRVYNAVQARLTLEGEALLNSVHDQYYTVGESWGVVESSITDTILLNDRPLNLNFRNKYTSCYTGQNIEYKLYLPAGEYRIYTGHVNWLGQPVAMDIRINGATVEAAFTLDDFGQNYMAVNNYSKKTGGELSITFNAANGGIAAVSFIAVEKTIEVIAPMHDVTFNPDNGENTFTITAKEGNTVPKPADPSKNGFTFKGWYLGETEFNFTTPITSPISLKARWDPIAVTILKGDVNFDGVVDVLDLTRILDHINGDRRLSGDALYAADANNDGYIDVIDLTLVLDHINGTRLLW